MLIYSLITGLMESSGVHRVDLHIVAECFFMCITIYCTRLGSNSPSHIHGYVRIDKMGFVSVEAILVTHLTFQPSSYSLIKHVPKKLPLI